MDYYRLVLTFVVVIAAALIERSFGTAVLKSLCQTEFECKQYLQTTKDGGDCFRRCELLVLRSWNETCAADNGLKPVAFSQHFTPDQYDPDYLKRTRECIAAGLGGVPADDDVCRRASIDWRCYQEQFGRITKKPQFLPVPHLVQLNAIAQCSQMLQIDPKETELYVSNRYDVSARSRCLFRCVLSKMGLYNDVDLVDVDRLYIQCGDYGEAEGAFGEKGRQCMAQLQQTNCYDNCTLATRIINDCFPESFKMGIVVGGTVQITDTSGNPTLTVGFQLDVVGATVTIG